MRGIYAFLISSRIRARKCFVIALSMRTPTPITSAVRRQLASLVIAAAASPRGSLAAPPPAPFSIDLPPSFVKLSSVASPDVLLVAGDFRNLIGATGAATTIAVQRVTLRPGLLPVQPDEAPAAAAALASFRDSQAGNGYVSWPLASTIQWDAHAGLTFEFLTPLIGNAAHPETPSSDFVRHTIVRATPLPAADGTAPSTMVVLWAGARATDWNDGVGAELIAAARSCDVRR